MNHLLSYATNDRELDVLNGHLTRVNIFGIEILSYTFEKDPSQHTVKMKGVG